jgi:hypothetical protein
LFNPWVLLFSLSQAEHYSPLPILINILDSFAEKVNVSCAKRTRH